MIIVGHILLKEIIPNIFLDSKYRSLPLFPYGAVLF